MSAALQTYFILIGYGLLTAGVIVGIIAVSAFWEHWTWKRTHLRGWKDRQ